MATQKTYGGDKGYGEEGAPVSLCAGECRIQVRRFRRTAATKIEVTGEGCPAISDEEFNAWMKRIFPDTLLDPRCPKGCSCEIPEVPDDDPIWKRKRWVTQDIEGRRTFRKIIGGAPDEAFGQCRYTVSGSIEKKSIIVMGTCD